MGVGRGYESGGAEVLILYLCFWGDLIVGKWDTVQLGRNCYLGYIAIYAGWNHMFLFIWGCHGEFKISLRNSRGGRIFLRSFSSC